MPRTVRAKDNRLVRAAPLSVDELLAEIRRRLNAAVDPVFAEGQRRFFRHEVNTMGVRRAALSPIVSFVYSAVRKWPVAERNRLCEALWRGPLEEGNIACYLCRRFARECGGAEFRLFERWIDRYVRNWAHCDGVASWLLAACIANEPALIGELDRWTRSRNRWKRRGAAVALLQEAKQGRNTDAIFRIATQLADDADDMVQKGVGWLLKETYPKRPAEVVRFLTPWRATAPRLLIRYAAEKMTPRDRAFVMARRA
ncbi:MAG TPA: DNA alkylation repair protein [Bryobacteraceae bacterium]|jgi:3-methyladenine DNA glycosylase AlkD|nr:DNA alkylation repair protein [Bryobacteraceae bacterium]